MVNCVPWGWPNSITSIFFLSALNVPYSLSLFHRLHPPLFTLVPTFSTHVHSSSPLFTLLYFVLHCSYLLFTLGQSCPLLFTLVHSVHSPDPTCSLLFALVPFLSVLFILVNSRSMQFTIVTCFYCCSLQFTLDL